MSEEKLCLVSKVTMDLSLTSKVETIINVVSSVIVNIEEVSRISTKLYLTSAFHLEECVQ